MSTTTSLSRRKQRIRAKVRGTAQRPRLTVYVSNRAISCQVIDDTTGKTLAAASSLISKNAGRLTEQAPHVGVDIAKAAKAAKIVQVAFDRNGRKYHGRIKALADSARGAGLEF
jgi:large subunit ribosomal protein L18